LKDLFTKIIFEPAEIIRNKSKGRYEFYSKDYLKNALMKLPTCKNCSKISKIDPKNIETRHCQSCIEMIVSILPVNNQYFLANLTEELEEIGKNDLVRKKLEIAEIKEEKQIQKAITEFKNNPSQSKSSTKDTNKKFLLVEVSQASKRNRFEDPDKIQAKNDVNQRIVDYIKEKIHDHSDPKVRDSVFDLLIRQLPREILSDRQKAEKFRIGRHRLESRPKYRMSEKYKEMYIYIVEEWSCPSTATDDYYYTNNNEQVYFLQTAGFDELLIDNRFIGLVLNI